MKTETEKLLTKAVINAFEKQGDTSEKQASEIQIICKLFNPVGAGTWYLYERLDDDVFMCFANLGDPTFAECGTVSLSELMSLKLPLGLKIERDRHFGKKTLQEVIDSVQGN
jgi:hypothetical protein